MSPAKENGKYYILLSYNDIVASRLANCITVQQYPVPTGFFAILHGMP